MGMLQAQQITELKAENVDLKEKVRYLQSEIERLLNPEPEIDVPAEVEVSNEEDEEQVSGNGTS